MKKIVCLIPLYNEQEVLGALFLRLGALFDSLCARYEMSALLVDDGSADGSLALLREQHARDGRFRYLSLSRNFGKEAAMMAGFDALGTADAVIVLDADLQDPPRLLKSMLHGIQEEGYDCVASRRVTRAGEPKVRSFFARSFYRLINHISQTEIVDGARDFRLMTRQMVNSILSLTEVSRFSKGIFSWVGYRTKWLEYENVERVAGETKWSFWKLFVYSIEGITSFSTAPLALAALMGVLFCILAFVFLIFIWSRAMIFGDKTSGWPSLVCIILLISGVQFFCMGILGQYLAKTYLEVKRRPIYLIKEDI